MLSLVSAYLLCTSVGNVFIVVQKLPAMFFDYGRIEGLPSQYSAVRNSVTVDVLEAGFFTAYVILLFSLLLVQPKCNKFGALFSSIRITISLTIGLLIMLGNIGQEWEVAQISSTTPYKAGVVQEINASIGVKIGLRSVNITLRSDVPPNSTLGKEVIDYNERFHWTWDQGRFGFGPFAGKLQQEFRAAQYNGVPTPILWIADYFVIDGEGFRFGRFYRTAGWYSHILMWTGLATWLVSNILFMSVIEYGAYFLGITGLLQLTATLIWFVVRNPNPLVIPFEDDTLRTNFGSSFWITFVNGTICVILSLVIIVIERFTNMKQHNFFGVDPLNSYQTAYITDEEQSFLRRLARKSHAEDETGAVEMNSMPAEATNKRNTSAVMIPKREVKNLIKASRDSAVYDVVEFKNPT